MANFEAEEKRHRRTRKRGSWYVRFLKGFAAFMALLWVPSALDEEGSVLGPKALILVLVVGVYLAYVYRRLNFDAIVLRQTRARLVDKFQAFHVHNVVEEVCVAAGLEKPRIAVVDDPALNAFSVSMRNTERNVIVFTSGLVETLKRDELQGVVAHELAQMVNRSESYFHADATAVRLTRNPSGLRRALERIAAGSSSVERSPRNARHLWFADPGDAARSAQPGTSLNLHPPLSERIEVLRRLEGVGPAPVEPVLGDEPVEMSAVLPRTPAASAALARGQLPGAASRPVLYLLLLLVGVGMSGTSPLTLLVLVAAVIAFRRWRESQRTSVDAAADVTDDVTDDPTGDDFFRQPPAGR